MIWMRLFWTFVLTLLLYAVVDLAQSSWAAAEKASEAWSGKSSAEGQIEFLQTGLSHALGRHPFLQGLSDFLPYSGQPQPFIGWMIFAFFLLTSFALMAGIFILLKNLKQKSDPEKVAETKSQKWSFALFLVLLVASGGLGIKILQEHEIDTDKWSEIHAPPNQEPMSMEAQALAIQLIMGLQNNSMSIDEIKSAVKRANDKGTLDPRSLGKVFGLVLQQCRVELLEFLSEFTMIPTPKDYDYNYMQSQYANLTNPECEAYYKKMGWAKGCEYTPSNKPCEDFQSFDQKYMQFFESMQKASGLKCDKVSDCLFSERRPCGEVLVSSRQNIREDWFEMMKKWSCPYKKRLNACYRSNPKFFNCATPPPSQQVPACENNLCQWKNELPK